MASNQTRIRQFENSKTTLISAIKQIIIKLTVVIFSNLHQNYLLSHHRVKPSRKKTNASLHRSCVYIWGCIDLTPLKTNIAVLFSTRTCFRKMSSGTHSHRRKKTSLPRRTSTVLKIRRINTA